MTSSEATTPELPVSASRVAASASSDVTTPDQDQPRATRLVFDAWLGAHENPIAAHRAVLRLTYGVTPALVLISVMAHVLGVAMPLWLIALLGTLMLATAWSQERLLLRGTLAPWMPAAHLNLGLLLLSVWVAFSGGVHSPFVWVYAVAIAVYGTLWGFRSALATATLCTVHLLVILGLSRAGMGVALVVDPTLQLTRLFLISYIAMFYLVALVGGALGRQVREIFRLAQTDPLTGLANRRALRQMLDRELARADRYGEPCAVLVLEIDRFKAVNDRFGHLAGDEVLRKVAATLRGSCRASDLLARFGGDEFVVVMPHTSADLGTRVADRVRRDIEEYTLLRGFHLTVSAGLAVYPDQPGGSRNLVEAADRAMYRVKQRGGNGIAVA